MSTSDFNIWCAFSQLKVCNVRNSALRGHRRALLGEQLHQCFNTMIGFLLIGRFRFEEHVEQALRRGRIVAAARCRRRWWRDRRGMMDPHRYAFQRIQQPHLLPRIVDGEDRVEYIEMRTEVVRVIDR